MAEDSEQPDQESKTEDASAKKLEEARSRGQVAQSRDLNTWIILLVSTLLVGLAVPRMFADFTDFLKNLLANAHAVPANPGSLMELFALLSLKSLSSSAIFFIVLVIAALAGPLLQVGPLVAPEVLKPDFSKISLSKGFARLFSLRSIMEFVKGLLKISFVGVVGYVLVAPYLQNAEHSILLTPLQALEESEKLAMRMLTGILAALFVMAMADFMFQKWEFSKQMRMTKQEVKEEYKQSEGDPYIKGRLKQMRMERARRRMMQNVPKADVVITNPTHFSVALKYDTDVADAPVVIAKGIDEVALRIRKVASEHDIILFENPPLARSIYDTVEIDQTIPEELYRAVAEVISYVYKKKGKVK